MSNEAKGSNAAESTVVEETSTVAGGEVDETETVDYWKAKAATLEAESAKHRKARQKAADDLKNAKKGISEDGQDYKKLYEQEGSKAAKLVEKMKRADITAAATAQLAKLGVVPDLVPLALKAMDINLIEWDEEDGVDATSLRGAVQSVKNEFGALFEKKVERTQPKNATDGKSGGNDNEMTRAAFDKLSGAEKAATMARKVKIVD